MLSANDQAKIRALYQEIYAVYKESIMRPSGKVCDICGDGDQITKTGYLRKTRHPVAGYTHRKDVSPTLCWRHAGGWSHSYTKYDWDNTRTSEEIDLHFAKFLAKNLSKAANQRSNEPIL